MHGTGEKQLPTWDGWKKIQIFQTRSVFGQKHVSFFWNLYPLLKTFANFPGVVHGPIQINGKSATVVNATGTECLEEVNIGSTEQGWSVKNEFTWAMKKGSLLFWIFRVYRGLYCRFKRGLFHKPWKSGSLLNNQDLMESRKVFFQQTNRSPRVHVPSFANSFVHSWKIPIPPKKTSKQQSN